MAGLGTFDFSAFEKFGADLEAMRRAFPAFMVECVQELANRLLAKTVPRTPVEDGELRRGWTIGQVTMTSAGAVIEVHNPVYYSPYVEYGHRTANGQGWVEGRFMMTISLQELERELPAIMDRKIKQFVTRYLGS
jgi:hypothetical protein